MEVNFTVVALTALVPLIIGFIWYHKNVFGSAWMRETGMTEENAKGANIALIFGLTYIFSFFVAFSLQFLTIHQFSILSVIQGEPDFMNPESEAGGMAHAFLAKYGHTFRTFKHGVLHGVISAITLALPVIGVNALFERRSAKYIFIDVGFWIVCFGIMGGLVCQFV
jgi:hypothetical protein